MVKYNTTYGGYYAALGDIGYQSEVRQLGIPLSDYIADVDMFEIGFEIYQYNPNGLPADQ